MSPDVHTLTGAYALDALDEFERRQFDAHLAECPDCAREAAELRATAARLALAVAEQPPGRLRQRVLAEIAVTRQDSPGGIALPRGGGTGRRINTWGTRLVAVAAAVATVAAVLLGVTALRASQERDTARAQLAQLSGRYQAISQVAAAPDARASSGSGIDGGVAFVVDSSAQNRGVLLVSGLPAPPPGHTYQAWLLGPSQPRSVGLLPPAAANRNPAPLVFDNVDGARKIGLTIEPATGSPQPTTTPVVLFSLPS